MDLVSPQPFWPLRNGLLSVYPSLKEDVTCDIVVLGAGISGAFVAECLSREGLDIVVLDKRDVGGGSTSASTALLQYEIDMPLVEFSFSRPAALVSQTAAELDCHRFTHALLARAAGNGARIFDQTLVNKFETAVDGVRLQTNRSCKIVADHAVFATGYEAQEFLPKRVVKLKSTYAMPVSLCESFRAGGNAA